MKTRIPDLLLLYIPVAVAMFQSVGRSGVVQVYDHVIEQLETAPDDQHVYIRRRANLWDAFNEAVLYRARLPYRGLNRAAITVVP